MPRMFDILRDKIVKKIKEDEKKTKETPHVDFPGINKKEEIESPPGDPLSFPKNMLQPDVEKEKSLEDYSLASKKLIVAVKQLGVDNEEKALEIYEGAVDVIKALLFKVRAKENLSGYMDKLYELLDNVFKQLVLGDNLLHSVYDDREGEYYLPYHIVNILILSYALGLNTGFNKSRLSHLGLASIFCDLGIDSMEEMVKQSKTFTSQEREVANVHICESLEIVNSIGVLNEIVKETIAMHHERASGNGYPRGIGLADINSYARILGLVDVYEAMTHARPYKEKISAHNAVRALIGPLKNDFDTDVLKVFINKMSVYPIGSVVKLDTKEMARVISVKSGSPLRPVVMVFRGPNGENISEMNIIDLSKQDFPAIRE